ncbi:MAG: MBL fold metallo-hydrolase, partial [bacterium]|nr:MBL fold metallo-hydrolase [bacterium]
PQESLLYQNFVKANDVLQAALAAHGGTGLLDRSVSFRLKTEGSYFLEGHYVRPWASREYVLRESVVFSPDLEMIRFDSYANYNRPLEGFTILDATHGISRGTGSKNTEVVAEDELEATRDGLLRSFPQSWLRDAREFSATLRFIGETEAFNVIHFTNDESESYALFFNRKTDLLHRVENIGHWKLKGDRLEWLEYTEYEERDGYLIAMRSRRHGERYSGQDGEDARIAEIEFNVDIDESEFIVDEKYAEGFEDWSVAAPVVEEPESPFLPSTDLGDGLYVIDLPACDSRSLLVEFSDYSVIVEAGDHSAIAEKLLDTAAHLLPQKPVKYVGMTHHHPLYSGGLRPYANRGVTILTTAGNVDYYKDLTLRPYRIEPDAQEKAPRAPIIQVIDEQLILEDDTQRLEFHAFDPGTHVEEFVLPYVPSHKLVITGDFVYFGKEKREPRPAGSRKMALYNIIQERDLDVETIVQTWYLTEGKQQGSMAAVEESVRLAREAEAKDD